MMRGLHTREDESWEAFRERSVDRSRQMFREAGFKSLVEKVMKYNFEYAVQLSQYKCHPPSSVYSKSLQQTLRVMLHASGEWTVRRDAVIAACSRSQAWQGRRRLAGRPRLAVMSWHTPFETWRSLLWYDTDARPTDWEDFQTHISQIPKMEEMFSKRNNDIEPSGFFKDPDGRGVGQDP